METSCDARIDRRATGGGLRKVASTLVLLPLLAAGTCPLSATGGEETAALQEKPAGESSAEQAVRALFRRLMNADNQGDVDGVVTCYAPDAVLLPPDGTSVSGADAIRRRYQSLFSTSRLEVRMSVDGLDVGQRLAWARGTTRGSVVPRDGSSARELADRYLMVLRHEGASGEWRIAVLAWSPLPESSGATTPDPEERR